MDFQYTIPHEERRYDPLAGMQDLGAAKENERIRGEFTDDEIKEAIELIEHLNMQVPEASSRTRSFKCSAAILRRLLGEETL